MNYDVSSLTSAADCDAIINTANLKKTAAELDAANSLLTLNSFSGGGEGFPILIQTKETHIANLTAALDGMAEGDTRNVLQEELNRSNVQLSSLKRKAENFGVFAQIERQMEIGQLESSAAEFEAFIASVIARKAEIEANQPN